MIETAKIRTAQEQRWKKKHDSERESSPRLPRVSGDWDRDWDWEIVAMLTLCIVVLVRSVDYLSALCGSLCQWLGLFSSAAAQCTVHANAASFSACECERQFNIICNSLCACTSWEFLAFFSVYYYSWIFSSKWKWVSETFLISSTVFYFLLFYFYQFFSRNLPR